MYNLAMLAASRSRRQGKTIVQAGTGKRARLDKPVLSKFGQHGRNAKCPCGSNKKYKNCCINEKPVAIRID